MRMGISTHLWPPNCHEPLLVGVDILFVIHTYVNREYYLNKNDKIIKYLTNTWKIKQWFFSMSKKFSMYPCVNI
jgi:hypothetical protein